MRWNHIEDWETVKAGLYAESSPNDLDAERSRQAYAEFLSDDVRFRKALQKVLKRWPVACRQFLSNESINRIAWLGQAAMCVETGVPCKYRAGFALLTDEQQARANATAEEAFRQWQESQVQSAQLSLPDPAKPVRGMHAKVSWYRSFWMMRGYQEDLPEEVPSEVSSKNYAPSWRAIAVAILSNDVALQSLGFSGPHSEWYGILKRVELSERGAT